MDNTLQELENELKRLSPRELPASVLVSLERDLGAAKPATPAARRRASATTLRFWKWGSWSLAGAAALTALAWIQFARNPSVPANAPAPSAEIAKSGQSDQPGPAVPATNHYEPVRATSVLYDLHEGDATMLPDRTEGREVRYRYVDTYTWKNPATNASLRWSVPRDEVRLVRATLD